MTVNVTSRPCWVLTAKVNVVSPGVTVHCQVLSPMSVQPESDGSLRKAAVPLAWG